MERSFVKYLPLDDRAFDWHIYCTDAGCKPTSAGAHYPPSPAEHPPAYRQNITTKRILNEFQIVYITRGRGVLRWQPDNSCIVEAGTAFLLFPGVWHAYSPDAQTGWDEYWVGFTGPFPATLLQRGLIGPERPAYRIGLQDTILSDFAEIFDLAEREPPGFQLRLGASIIQIIAKILTTSYREAQQSGAEQIVAQAKFHMEENLYGDIAIDGLLSGINLSYSAFLKLFKNYTGLSPHQYFLQMKLNRAKTLLQQPGRAVKEIALGLGFRDQFYFSRLFKSKIGVTPTQWQSRMNGRS
ncbi:MAG TPA: AraC family transcriptional regulator [Spirochaetia bacterium]|nr:AraC family transcriptional regulator [Spirochaetia bacterium]